MRYLKQLAVVVCLLFTLTQTTWADDGIIYGGKTPPPPPSATTAGVISIGVASDISAPKSGETSVNDSLTEIALQLLHSTVAFI